MSTGAGKVGSDNPLGGKGTMHRPAERVATMLRIRRFEEQCVALSKAGKLLGHYHVYIGQEATAVAACAVHPWKQS